MRTSALSIALLLMCALARAGDPTPRPTPSPEPTPSPSPTATTTPTPTPTAQPTPTPEPTPTTQPTPTPTPSPTPTATATPTPTPAPTPPPDCERSVTTFSFEGGIENWVLDNSLLPDAPGLWSRTTNCAANIPGHFGEWVLGYSEAPESVCRYQNGTPNSGTAKSPQIAIPSNATRANLSMNYFLDIELLSTDVRIEILTMNDTVATLIAGTGPGSPVILGNTGDTWQFLQLDLSDFIGQTISVRLRFENLSFVVGSSTLQGWYVDDVFVCTNVVDATPTDTPTPSPTPTPTPSPTPQQTFIPTPTPTPTPRPNAARHWEKYR